jgi:hypothetical protein
VFCFLKFPKNLEKNNIREKNLKKFTQPCILNFISSENLNKSANFIVELAKEHQINFEDVVVFSENMNFKQKKYVSKNTYIQDLSQPSCNVEQG